MEEIVQRTADAMDAEGRAFQGVLFAGLMIKDGKVGITVCRIGTGISIGYQKQMMSCFCSSLNISVSL